MIKFMSLNSNDSAVDHLKKTMDMLPFMSEEEKQKMADAACSLAVKFLRSLDEPIMREYKDDDDRRMLQQLTLMLIRENAEKAMQRNALEGLIKALKL